MTGPETDTRQAQAPATVAPVVQACGEAPDRPQGQPFDASAGGLCADPDSDAGPRVPTGLPVAPACGGASENEHDSVSASLDAMEAEVSSGSGSGSGYAAEANITSDPAGQTAAARWPIQRWRAGQPQAQADWLVDEAPVTLHWLCAGTGSPLAQVSALVTPVQLEAFARGHSLLEGWLDDPAAIQAIDVLPLHGRLAVTVSVAPGSLRRTGVRLPVEPGLTTPPAHAQAAIQASPTRLADLASGSGMDSLAATPVNSACGLCGEADARPWLSLPAPLWTWDSQPTLPLAVLGRAIESLGAEQPLQGLTGSAHAAAWLDEATGNLLLTREDVGRHHALDKLAGALSAWRQASPMGAMPPAGGTVLMSSRASAELVRKAVRMGARRLVCLGGATHLAAQWAHQAGLGLAAFARPGQMAVIAGTERFGG